MANAGSIIGSIPSNANCAMRELQVSIQAVQLRETLGLLNDRLVELGCRLEAVLRQVPEVCSKPCPDPPQEYLVPLANDYRNNREQVEGMINCVNSYLQRLEL